MSVTFRQLRLFLALAEHGSVTAAAEACSVTQPTVSVQLRQLSNSVGLPLYEQIGKRLHLTAAGEALVRTARTMLDEWLAFEQTVGAMRGLERGRLRVSVASTAKYFIPRLLGSFCAEHPSIEISLEILNRDGVVARLRENRDDIYVLSMPPGDLDLVQHPLLPNPLVVIAHRSHPLAGRPVALAELAAERFILRERGSGTRLAGDAHFAGAGFTASVRLELGSNEAVKQSVAGGLGIAVISRRALAANPDTEQLAILDVEGFPVNSNWFTLYPRGKRLSPLATVFLEHLHRAVKDQHP